MDLVREGSLESNFLGTLVLLVETPYDCAAMCLDKYCNDALERTGQLELSDKDITILGSVKSLVETPSLSWGQKNPCTSSINWRAGNL